MEEPGVDEGLAVAALEDGGAERFEFASERGGESLTLTADDVRTQVGELMKSADLTKFILGTSPRYTEEAARRLAAFDKPLLLAWAPEDKFFPIAHGRRLAEIAPKATLVEIPGARTFVSLDQPERFARAIEAFVG